MLPSFKRKISESGRQLKWGLLKKTAETDCILEVNVMSYGKKQWQTANVNLDLPKKSVKTPVT